ncbi:hypothetical protein, partial [Nocardioides sp.]|uniref:hypothetical protein n=1 Tax=Nocardioides sp. TaxID=35761 RepID=UPI002ED90C3D
MTITSIGAPTVTATDPAAGDARGTGTGTDGFVALVQALLDAGPSGTGTPGGPAQGGVPALPGDPTTEAA